MKNYLTLVLLLSCFINYSAKASINLLTGSYHYKTSLIHDLKATYNSRSTYVGFLGLGWCTEIESKLKFINNDPELLECGQKIAPTQIIKKRDGYYYNNNKFYDKNGTLIKIVLNNKIYKIIYKNLLPVQLHKADGFLRLHFSFQEPNLITSIEDKTTQQFTYNGLLLKSITTKHEEYHFEYSEFDNLVKIQKNTQVLETITYDELSDRVLAVRSPSCEQNVNYKMTDLFATSELSTNCQNSRQKIKATLYYSFNQNQQRYLSSILLKKGSENIKIESITQLKTLRLSSKQSDLQGDL